ncbi:MAG: pirin family protein [Actinomycetota bacterium]|nr:pirin family protein [Actinomycetota bacterium]
MSERDEIVGRSIDLGGISVDRFLPKAKLRTVGPWCFVDRMSNLNDPLLAAMEVAPHPHMGLSTVTYLLKGTVEHRDSLGNRIDIVPGHIDVMTAGAGISHSEVSRSGQALMGLQLWAALPSATYLGQSGFRHFSSGNSFEVQDFEVELISGNFMDESFDVGLSHSALCVIITAKSNSFELKLNPMLEHIFVPIVGDLQFDDVASGKAAFLHEVDSLRFSGTVGSKFMVLGGEPFGEKILMWWNFVGRSWDELTEARRQWNQDDGRFGSFSSSYSRIEAPQMLR